MGQYKSNLLFLSISFIMEANFWERGVRKVRKRNYIVLCLLVFSLAVTLIDALVHPPYFSKIAVKVVFFLALPLLFFVRNREDRAQFRALFRFRRRGITAALALGCAIYALILGGYFAVRGFVDFGAVTGTLTAGMGITADNFLLVAAYISLLNSLLEEFFFRAFGFMTLRRQLSGAAAWLLSPVLFAVYHTGMLWGMFHPAMIALLMLGLVAGGLIFNALCSRFESVYPAWFAHMAANFAINTVGCILFGVL